jgi:hypothetical protein
MCVDVLRLVVRMISLHVFGVVVESAEIVYVVFAW